MCVFVCICVCVTCSSNNRVSSCLFTSSSSFSESSEFLLFSASEAALTWDLYCSYSVCSLHTPSDELRKFQDIQICHFSSGQSRLLCLLTALERPHSCCSSLSPGCRLSPPPWTAPSAAPGCIAPPADRSTPTPVQPQGLSLAANGTQN